MIRGVPQGMYGLGWAIVVGVLLALANPTGVAVAQVSTPTVAGDQMYVDPTNRFAVPIPTNWTAEEHDGYVRVVTNDGKIAISAAIVDASGASAGIGVFLRMIDPDFESAELDDLLATPATETDANAIYTFDDGAESGQLLQALGRRAGDDIFVLVLAGELEAVKLRQLQVDKIFEGILIRVESDASPVASPSA